MKLLLCLSVALLFATVVLGAENEINFIFAGMIPASPPTAPCTTCTPSAADADAALCTVLEATETSFGNLLYENGTGAPLTPQQIDWNEVTALLGPDYKVYDESGFPWAGVYDDFESYWVATFDFPDIVYLDGFPHWQRCRELVTVELWTEVWGQASNTANNITVLSWYTYEWNADGNLDNTYYVTSATTADWSQAIYPDSNDSKKKN